MALFLVTPDQCKPLTSQGLLVFWTTHVDALLGTDYGALSGCGQGRWESDGLSRRRAAKDCFDCAYRPQVASGRVIHEMPGRGAVNG